MQKQSTDNNIPDNFFKQTKFIAVTVENIVEKNSKLWQRVTQ